MKKSFTFIAVAIMVIFIFTAAVSMSEEVKNNTAKTSKIEDCVKNISKVQSLLEYFYLQSGFYPETLEALEKSYNVPNEKGEPKEKIEVPKDPATGKSFFYKSDEKNPLNYVLAAPDSKAYGVDKIELTALDWGWMKAYAGEERRKWGLSLCVDLLKRLATDIEIYASENKKQFPKSLETLIKAKFDVPDVLTCPVCKKLYVYELNKDSSYFIKCADPAAHKLKQLEYDSLKGIVGK